jgi:glycosyltransferase involved in cell wall biosynthesis
MAAMATQPSPANANVRAIDPLAVLIVVPTLDMGAADRGTLDLVGILASAGHRPIVVSRGGRLQPLVEAAGGEVIQARADSQNPFVMLRNAVLLARLVRSRGCNVIHAHGRAPAWSAFLAARLTGVPFLTTWYKGFREQNRFKRFYNSVMARGDRIVAVSDQIAELIHNRYRTPAGRVVVMAASVDLDRFDPAAVSLERIQAVRRAWGVGPQTKVILVVGRLLRRKGHDVVVRAARRLKDMGLKDFLCVFVGDDQGRSRYTGELWDLVESTNTADVTRLAGAIDDLPAAYAASTLVLSAALQEEGLQRAILEAGAMARPVVVSDLGAGPELVRTPPSVPEDRMTGLRFAAGDDAALAASLIRLFSLAPDQRKAMGARGREWVAAHFNSRVVTDATLQLYADVARLRGRACCNPDDGVAFAPQPATRR